MRTGSCDDSAANGPAERQIARLIHEGAITTTVGADLAEHSRPGRGQIRERCRQVVAERLALVGQEYGAGLLEPRLTVRRGFAAAGLGRVAPLRAALNNLQDQAQGREMVEPGGWQGHRAIAERSARGKGRRGALGDLGR